MATKIDKLSRDQENFEDTQQEEMPQPTAFSTNLPAKNHLIKLENQIMNLMRDIETDKKNIQILRSEITSLGHCNNEQCADISRFTMDEIIRLTKDLREIQIIEQDENNFLKQQLNTLTQDRIKLQQNALVLENQIYEAEKDLGYKHFK